MDKAFDPFQTRILNERTRLREVAGEHLFRLQPAKQFKVECETRQRTQHALIRVRRIFGAHQQQDALPLRRGEKVGGERASEKPGGTGDENRGLKRGLGVHEGIVPHPSIPACSASDSP